MEFRSQELSLVERNVQIPGRLRSERPAYYELNDLFRTLSEVEQRWETWRAYRGELIASLTGGVSDDERPLGLPDDGNIWEHTERQTIITAKLLRLEEHYGNSGIHRSFRSLIEASLLHDKVAEPIVGDIPLLTKTRTHDERERAAYQTIMASAPPGLRPALERAYCIALAPDAKTATPEGEFFWLAERVGYLATALEQYEAPTIPHAKGMIWQVTQTNLAPVLDGAMKYASVRVLARQHEESLRGMVSLLDNQRLYEQYGPDTGKYLRAPTWEEFHTYAQELRSLLDGVVAYDVPSGYEAIPED